MKQFGSPPHSARRLRRASSVQAGITVIIRAIRAACRPSLRPSLSESARVGGGGCGCPSVSRLVVSGGDVSRPGRILCRCSESWGQVHRPVALPFARTHGDFTGLAFAPQHPPQPSFYTLSPAPDRSLLRRTPSSRFVCFRTSTTRSREPRSLKPLHRDPYHSVALTHQLLQSLNHSAQLSPSLSIDS